MGGFLQLPYIFAMIVSSLMVTVNEVFAGVIIVIAVFVGLAVLFISLLHAFSSKSGNNSSARYFEEQENIQKRRVNRTIRFCPECEKPMRLDKEFQGFFCKRCER